MSKETCDVRSKMDVLSRKIIADLLVAIRDMPPKAKDVTVVTGIGKNGEQIPGYSFDWSWQRIKIIITNDYLVLNGNTIYSKDLVQPDSSDEEKVHELFSDIMTVISNRIEEHKKMEKNLRTVIMALCGASLDEEE